MEDLPFFSSFDDMNLNESILRGIYAYGFEKPSSIQSRGIVPIANGRDVLGQAQSGTGKTATFIIGMLQRLDPTVNETQALILAPTRELVDQIHCVTTIISDFMNVRCHMCMGGRSIQDDICVLRAGVHIVVGTPGRVLDMINRNYLKLTKLRVLIIDEADEMLSIGFKDQIYDVFDAIPDESQVCLFSATISNAVTHLTEQFMHNPVSIRVMKDEITLDGIRQFYVNVEQDDYKFITLCDLYEKLTIRQAIIYCNTRKTVEYLAEKMTEQHFSVTAFHADLSQLERSTLMRQFRSGQTRVLISTDILSRGIDVQQVSIVFNYDIPTKKENYIHRIGRSGRFGRKGVAINLITKETEQTLQLIQQFYNTVIDELPATLDL